LSFFSDFAFAFAWLDFGFAAGFRDAFAGTFFLGVDFGIGFGVVLALTAGVAVGFGSGVAVAVGFGVAVGNSISLFALVTTGFSSAASSCSGSLDSVSAAGCFANGNSCFCDSSAERSPAPNHTMFSGLDGAFAAALQRMSPVMSTTCASAIRKTFRQNPRSLPTVILTANRQLRPDEALKREKRRQAAALQKPRMLSGQ